MPHTFTASNGITYNYVKATEIKVIERPTVVDFGVTDKKGRAVTATRSVSHVTKILADEPVKWGELFVAGKPTSFYRGLSAHQRDGETFGGSWIEVFADTAEKAAAELDKRIEQARRRAVAKFGK